MSAQLAKLKRIAIFLATIFSASISGMVHADWSIKGLGTLGGADSYAYGINDSGQVVGYSSLAGDYPRDSHAFLTGPNGIGITDLGTLGGRESLATAINDSGQVVGWSDTASGSSHAFITGPNGIGMTDLGTLGGSFSKATGINDSGQVVGDNFFGADRHAFITGPNGKGMTELGTLGGETSEAHGINDSGEVVGQSTTATGEIHSFVFSHGGITDLSLLAPVVAAGWTNLNALSINNDGQIAGGGQHYGNSEAFLLSFTTVVPEPETYLMLLGGLGLVGYLAWRRKEMAI